MSAIVNTHVVKSGSIDQNASVWYRLRTERERICEELLKEPRSSQATAMGTILWHRELLQSRLRKIDDALDRLLSGSYGNCSKCGRWIEDTKLDLDPAAAFCFECWQQQQTNSDMGRQTASAKTTTADPPESGVSLKALQPFDTIHVRTLSSDYRIFLLDPKSGRAVVEGGKHFTEPVEAIIICSSRGGETRIGWIGKGFHLEMWANEGTIRTSLIQSVSVEHGSPPSV